MSALLEMLGGQLSGDAMAKIGQVLGADQEKSSQVSGAVMSTLVGALAKNSSKPGGAD